MKTLTGILMIALMACSSPSVQEGSAVCMQTVGHDVFAKGISNRTDVIVLDVRTADEVADGYIEGAVVMDYQAKDFKNQLAKLTKDKPIYVYCASGGRSKKTCKMLEASGYCNIYDLDGGIGAWTENGHAVVKD